MPIKECEKIWVNGELVDWAEAKTHILTHALHYGSGVFEGIRAYQTPKGTAVFRLSDHMDRLIKSAKIHYFKPPYTSKQLCDATIELLEANKLKSCYIRPIMYRGYGEMGLNPLNSVVDTAIAAWEWGTYLGDEGLKNGIRTVISSYQKFPGTSLPPQAKACGQYINSILAKVEALNAGVDEAILLDARGMISEGPGENLFMVKDGELYTPPICAGILNGITRDTVMAIAKDLEIQVNEQDLDRGIIYSADELFFTGTAAEVTPIREVDGHEIGKPGEVTKKIQEKYFDAVGGKDDTHESWLSYI